MWGVIQSWALLLLVILSGVAVWKLICVLDDIQTVISALEAHTLSLLDDIRLGVVRNLEETSQVVEDQAKKGVGGIIRDVIRGR